MSAPTIAAAPSSSFSGKWYMSQQIPRSTAARPRATTSSKSTPLTVAAACATASAVVPVSDESAGRSAANHPITSTTPLYRQLHTKTRQTKPNSAEHDRAQRLPPDNRTECDESEHRGDSEQGGQNCGDISRNCQQNPHGCTHTRHPNRYPIARHLWARATLTSRSQDRSVRSCQRGVGHSFSLDLRSPKTQAPQAKFR